MQIILEPLTLEDYEAVLCLWQSCPGVGLNESDSRAAIGFFLQRNPGMSFVARRNGEVVGAVLSGHDGRRGYLHHLAVAPEHRRQGLGGRLVESCLEQLRALGIYKCNIFLYSNNPVGREFWLGAGWRERGDLSLMQISLGQPTAGGC